MSDCLHARFEAQVDRTPAHIAASAGADSLSYAELDQRANRLAHHLRSLGVGPETLVAIQLPRALDLIVAIVAVVKSGGAYVPLDGEHPQERRAFYLSDSAARVIITTSELAFEVRPDTALVLLDADAPRIARSPPCGRRR